MSNSQQPRWINDLTHLQRKVYEILKTANMPDETAYKILDGDSIINYWALVFTHKSIDTKRNYETLEFYGDKVMNFAFSQYIRSKFGKELNQEKATLLLNKWMSKKFQAQLSRQLGLVEYIWFDPEYPKVNISVQEDILEAFFGCLNNILEDKVKRGHGYIYCYDLIEALFKDVDIKLEEIQKDPKTQLKEIYDKMGWGSPQYTKNKLGEEFQVDVLSYEGDVIGTGYGSQKEAAFIAAQNALIKLASKGTTLKTAEKFKLERNRERNTEFNHQYKRVEEAIKKHNDQASKRGSMKIVEFKIANVHQQKVDVGFIYTYVLKLAYQGSKLIWKDSFKDSGDNGDKVKVNVMKKFADLWKIPE